MAAISSFSESEEKILPFACGPIFNTQTTPESLVEAFGAENVVHREIHEAEGFYEYGTVIYPDTPNQLEIFWYDSKSLRALRKVRVIGKHSAWQQPNGIRLGTDLKFVEKLNGYPFRLAGFRWDGSGSVISWGEKGFLNKRSDYFCRASLAFETGWFDDATWENVILKYGNVTGSDEFSSGHPTMQALNPTVNVMVLIFYIR